MCKWGSIQGSGAGRAVACMQRGHEGQQYELGGPLWTSVPPDGHSHPGRPDGHCLYSQHRGCVLRGPDSPCSRGLAQQRQRWPPPHWPPGPSATMEMGASHKQTPQVGLAACPIQGLRPRAARRGAGAASSPRGTHPRVPMPAPHSCTRFIHRRGQPARTHICSKRPKRPRIRRCRARAPSECGALPAAGSPPSQLLPGTALHPQGADLRGGDKMQGSGLTGREGALLSTA
ncbi:hypothetical protein GHT09_007006 [Marmota monax]|uniref:Uncharacterized protein n=1 Tax=Marmota monax TaxID=9995 RepID=A0A834UME8_MARMO|nr:hypothetical protein GHT09_007006 [Marmota monax]